MADTNHLGYFVLFIYLASVVRAADLILADIDMSGQTTVDTKKMDCTVGMMKLEATGVCMCLGGESTCVNISATNPPQQTHVILVPAHKDFARLASIGLLRALGLNHLSEDSISYVAASVAAGATTAGGAAPEAPAEAPADAA